MSNKVTQIVPITPAATQFGFRSNAATLAASRCSAITSPGISLITRSNPAGTIIRSSRLPITGRKSGMRSIGLNKYASTHAAKALACHGTLGSLEARKTACASVFSVRACCRHRSRRGFTIQSYLRKPLVAVQERFPDPLNDHWPGSACRNLL